MFQLNPVLIRKTYGQYRLGLCPLPGPVKCRQRLSTASMISIWRPRASIRNRHSLCSFNAAQQSDLSITTQTT